MGVDTRVRNRGWLRGTFSVTHESSNWLIYHCTLCAWYLLATNFSNRTRLEGRLALHLVEWHVDLGELLVD